MRAPPCREVVHRLLPPGAGAPGVRIVWSSQQRSIGSKDHAQGGDAGIQ